MPTMNEMRQGGTPFDPFLYATIGEDRNGNAVTVLSTLARLGLEPWDAAAELAGLTRAEARGRLDALLARFPDVPALAQNHAAIIQRLIELLPGTADRGTGPASKAGGVVTLGNIGPILGMVMLVLFIIQNLLIGWDGAGN